MQPDTVNNALVCIPAADHKRMRLALTCYHVIALILVVVLANTVPDVLSLAENAAYYQTHYAELHKQYSILKEKEFPIMQHPVEEPPPDFLRAVAKEQRKRYLQGCKIAFESQGKRIVNGKNKRTPVSKSS